MIAAVEATIAGRRCASRAHAMPYADVPGLRKSAHLDEVRAHGQVLTPGRYAGAADAEDDGVPFEEKFAALRERLEGQFEEGWELENRIQRALGEVSV